MSNIKKTRTTKSYESLNEIILDLVQILRPPEQLSVSDAAEKYVYINQPGAFVGYYSNSQTPYMREPSDTFTSRRYKGIVFVGGAQTGKTAALILNTVAYSIKVDPMDMMIFCPTMIDARDFGIRRIDRMHRHSEKIGEMLLPSADADNRFDKQYASGMLLTLGWPSATQVAGKPIGRIVITDRDRMPDDIDGDGELYDLASKRTTTFGSYAMTVCESSPSRPISDLKWIARSPHEAPPCEGILKLYNRGDRRRWYWPCPDCGEYFEGMFTHLTWDKNAGASNLDKADTVRLVCPVCGSMIHFNERQKMNALGRWIKDGQSITRDGQIVGPEPRTQIASFWLRGVAAGFLTWRDLLTAYLDASDEYDRTGSEEALKKFYNNDLGEPYYPKSGNDLRLPEVLKSRAEKLPERKVPKGVRFLVATIDVQKNMFVVQVFGILPGKPFDTVLIDRFDLRKSKRTDESGDALWVKPHAHLEDWDVLIEGVIEKEYELDDDSGRMMGIKQVGCDSGGKAGVTTRAYDFYRRLREENKHRRFILVKGDPLPNHPRTRISYPDSNRKDEKSGARGDIPVLMLNSNLLKDDLNGRLDCVEPGRGMFRIADWFSDSLFNELCGEMRTPKGWMPAPGVRNEAWDLSYYAIGLCISELMRVEGIKWDSPPGWAAQWDTNDLVREAKNEPRFALGLKSSYDFAEMAKQLA
jgi:phage terminase large subunit GpA-like protein